MDHHESPSEPVPVPADINLEDKIAFDLTARQLIILGGGLGLLVGAYHATRAVLSVLVFVLLAAPAAAGVVALALARRDGVSLDRYLLAVLRHLAATRRLTPAAGTAPEQGARVGGLGRGGWWARIRRPTPPLRVRAREVAQAPTFGVIDLGGYGLGALAVVSTVAWTLRSSTEQDALVATFARWLHSLSEPVQILIRAVPLDLDGHIGTLDHAADELGQPALAQAAADHAEHLRWIADQHNLLKRQIILVFREPTLPGPVASEAAQARRDRAALDRLARRLSDATALLAPTGITVTPLSAEQAATVLDSACRPLVSSYPPHPHPTQHHRRPARHEPAGPPTTPEPTQHHGRARVHNTAHNTSPNSPANTAAPAAARASGEGAAPPPGYTPDPAQGWYPLLGGWRQ
jgi:PrgI family protein